MEKEFVIHEGLPIYSFKAGLKFTIDSVKIKKILHSYE